MDHSRRPDRVAGDGRDADEVPALLPLHVGQRGRDPVEDALDVDVDGPVPVGDLAALERRMRHQPRVVDHDVDAAEPLDGRVDEALHPRSAILSVAAAHAGEVEEALKRIDEGTALWARMALPSSKHPHIEEWLTWADAYVRKYRASPP